MNVGRKELMNRKDEYEREKNVPIGMQLGVSRETGQVAQNTTVHIRVAEAKNLPAKDLSGTSDPFCILRVDNQEVARTATVWKDLSPFWGEDFTLHIPRGFHNISLYVYDEDLVGQDDIIGKLSLDHQTVTKSVKGVDGWFPLQPIVKDEEVQGNLEVELSLRQENGQDVLQVQVLQARGLAAKDARGTSDPFVKFSFRGETYKTEVVKKTLFPKWYQVFEIPLKSPLTKDDMIDFVLWDWDRMSHNDFMGQSRICVGGLELGHSRVAWYRLVAKKGSPGSARKSSDESALELGSLRVMVLVREDTILPSQYYKPLVDLMAKSVQPPWTSYANVVSMFEEVAVADKTEMATIMVKLYLGQGRVVEYLDYLNQRDLGKSEKATLFRGNSFATKSNDQFMKVVATNYLQQVLKPVIDTIYEEKKCCEIDPTKIEPTGRQNVDTLIESNVATIATYILRASKAIFGSVRQCPPVMRLAFKQLRKRVEERFPRSDAENADGKVHYLALSGFIFLRFFAPAILSPKLFFLKDSHPDKRTSRTLTLVAKAIQNMGNLGGQLSSAKEMFMKPLHPLIVDNVPQVKNFLDQLVAISDSLDDTSVVHYNTMAPVVMKEGYLMKKKGSSLALDVVGSMAMQKRYFWLSRYTLLYGKAADVPDKDRHTLSVQRILAVEPVDPAAFQAQNAFQIVYQASQSKTETYYFIAKDVNDQQQWISSVRKVCLQNREMWPIYHPGALRKGKWTCCQQPDKHAIGCSKSLGGVILGDYQDPLDPEAEAQTIYSQLWNGFETLRKKYVADRPFPSPNFGMQPQSFSFAVPHGPKTGLEQIDEVRVSYARHSSMGKALENPVSLPELSKDGLSKPAGASPLSSPSNKSDQLTNVGEVDEEASEPTKVQSPTAAGDDAENGTPKRRRKSLREALASPFTKSPGNSPKLARSSTTAGSPIGSGKHKKLHVSKSEAAMSHSPVVRLRSLGSLVRSGDPVVMTMDNDIDTGTSDSGKLQRHHTAPTMQPANNAAGNGEESKNGRHHPNAHLRPQFSNLSVNSVDSLPEHVIDAPRKLSFNTMVADFLSEDAGDDCLPLHQPLRAMSEMLLDELEKLYNAHSIYEKMPRRFSVLESA